MAVLDRARLTNTGFSIIANNCWAGAVYADLGLPYKTPTVGLFFFADCYLKLLEGFPQTIRLPLTFAPYSRYAPHQVLPYPVGVIAGDIEVHFMHERSAQEAAEKWQRRAARVEDEEAGWFFKFDDRDLCTPEHIARFHALPFRNKICFTVQPYPVFEGNVPVPAAAPSDVMVPDGNALLPLSAACCDLESWLSGGGIILKPEALKISELARNHTEGNTFMR